MFPAPFFSEGLTILECPIKQRMVSTTTAVTSDTMIPSVICIAIKVRTCTLGTTRILSGLPHPVLDRTDIAKIVTGLR